MEAVTDKFGDDTLKKQVGNGNCHNSILTGFL